MTLTAPPNTQEVVNLEMGGWLGSSVVLGKASTLPALLPAQLQNLSTCRVHCSWPSHISACSSSLCSWQCGSRTVQLLEWTNSSELLVITLILKAREDEPCPPGNNCCKHKQLTQVRLRKGAASIVCRGIATVLPRLKRKQSPAGSHITEGITIGTHPTQEFQDSEESWKPWGTVVSLICHFSKSQLHLSINGCGWAWQRIPWV